MGRSAWWTVTMMIAAFAGAAGAAETVLLKWKHTPGDYVMTVTQDTTSTMSMSSTSAKQNQRSQAEMIIETVIDKPTDQGQEIHMTYRRVRIDTASGPTTMSYDSAAANPTPSPVAGIFGAMIDHRLTMVLGPKGEVVEIRGVDEMWEKVIRTNPQLALLGDGMKKQFGEGLFNQAFTQQQKMMPDKPIAVGGEWSAETTIDLPVVGKMKVNQKCKLTELRKGVAVISFDGKLTSTQGDPTAVGATGMETQFEKMDLTLSGSHDFDPALGMHVASKVKTTGKLVLKMKPPQPSGGAKVESMVMSINIDGLTNMKLTRGKYVRPAKPEAKSTAK